MITLLAAAALAASPAPVGTVSSADAGEGNIVVLRADEALPLTAGDALMENDRVVLRGDATANLTAYGCSVTLEGASMATIDETLCGKTTTDFGYAQGMGNEVFAGMTGLDFLFLGGFMVGTALIVDEVTDDDDDDDDLDPVSP